MGGSIRTGHEETPPGARGQASMRGASQPQANCTLANNQAPMSSSSTLC